jgi:peptide/nickel transport system substrate-binding protein
LPQGRREKLSATYRRRFGAVASLVLLAMTARCTRSGPPTLLVSETTLRVGFADEGGSTSALNGIQQLRQILSIEGLARIGEDGRPVPGLAEGWTTAADGRSMQIRLRPTAKFHDGSQVDALTVAKSLNQVLPGYMGPAFRDIDQIASRGNTEVEIRFRRPSPFLLEALDALLPRPGASTVGTGAYMAVGPTAPNEMRANSDYYLGRPMIDRIVVNTYPNVRSAWAEMLRDHVDWLYDVGTEALDSLTSATNISVFSYVRHYQFVLIFNTAKGPLRSPEVRRALNMAIDRDGIIRDALDGHGTPSLGLVWPQHWAFQASFPKSPFDPQGAVALLGASRGSKPDHGATIRFKCLVRPALERMALVVKRQLEGIGVEMSVEEAPLDSILQAMTKHDFDAVLNEIAGGPSLFRPYVIWHSGGLGPGGMGSSQFDAALDRIRYAPDDDEYRSAVAALQKTTMDDPPAIFLAWPERARAVSKRFQVPAERGKDILTTLRMWRPVNAEKAASRN